MIKAQIENLAPETIEPLFNVLNVVKIETESRSLSQISGDHLPPQYSLMAFLRSFFMGEAEPCLDFDLELVNTFELKPLQHLDLLYRHPKAEPTEAWMLNRIGTLIHSRRAFAIACHCGFSRVVECFLEAHAIEWFGQCVSLLDCDRIHSPISAPRIMLSADRSAKKIGKSFFIHAGTNAWNSSWGVTSEWTKEWDVQVKNWEKLVDRVESLQSSLNISKSRYLFIPEKDTLARVAFPGYFNNGVLPLLIMMEYIKRLPAGSAIFPVHELAFSEHASRRLAIPDSHLSAHDYELIFSLVLKSLGHEGALPPFSGTEQSTIFSDLGGKFGERASCRDVFIHDGPKAELVMGDEQLQTPLRKNHIALVNENAPIQKSILILGDSHSSINMNPFLTFLAGCTFQRVEFIWNSFMVHNLKKSSLHFGKYDYLVSEISQRFVTPAVPLVSKPKESG